MDTPSSVISWYCAAKAATQAACPVRKRSNMPAVAEPLESRRSLKSRRWRG